MTTEITTSQPRALRVFSVCCVFVFLSFIVSPSLLCVFVPLSFIPGVTHSAPRAQETAQTSRSVWEGVYTEEQAKHGKELYTQECSKCHAADLTGLDEAPALSGGSFLANWDSLTVGDLFERIRISMPPNKKGHLSREQIADIISYVLSVNSFPTGKTELDHRTEMLKQIQILAAKPKS